MGAPDLLHALHDRGLRLWADGDRLMVAPRERIDDELRAMIREHKPELLAALATDALPDLVAVAAVQFEQSEINKMAAEAMENNAHLVYWHSLAAERPEIWNEAYGQDQMLLHDPAWANRSFKERFAEVVKRVKELIPDAPEPPKVITDAKAAPLKAAAEARRQKVLAMLAERPGLYRAAVADYSGRDAVIVTVAIRDVGTCELSIPLEKWEPFLFLEMVERSVLQ
jgi:hypothetical protein